MLLARDVLNTIVMSALLLLELAVVRGVHVLDHAIVLFARLMLVSRNHVVVDHVIPAATRLDASLSRATLVVVDSRAFLVFTGPQAKCLHPWWEVTSLGKLFLNREISLGHVRPGHIAHVVGQNVVRCVVSGQGDLNSAASPWAQLALPIASRCVLPQNTIFRLGCRTPHTTLRDGVTSCPTPNMLVHV